MADEKKEKLGFFKRFKKRILIISGSIITLVIVATVTLVLLFSDNNRFSGKIGSDDTVEVIKKNYIEGLKDIKSTGKFNFQISEDELNSILNKGTKSINSEYINQIYYGRGEKNHHFFYIDLNLPVITSRIVIDTVAKEGKNQIIKLYIRKTSFGKTNGYKFAKDKGILTSSFFNSFFKTCKLPITYNEKNLTFTVKTLEFLENFPKSSTISTTFFNLAKDIGSPVLKINLSTLGFSVDFSKFRSSQSLVAHDYSDEPVINFYTNLQDDLAVASTLLTDGDPKTISCISENDFNIALSNSIPSTMKEEVTSKLTKAKVTSSLVNIQTNFVDEGNATISLVYSINGYLVDAIVPLTYVDLTDSISFNSYFEIQYDINVGKYVSDGSEDGDACGQHFVNNLNVVFEKFASTDTLFTAFEDGLSLYFEGFASYGTDVDDASKEVTLDSEQLSFVLTKI